jgi:hypothetical protein
MKRKILLISLLFALFTYSSAQVSIKDSVIRTTILSPSYSYMFPGGDLADRFYSNSGIGGTFMLKNKKNWVFGIEGTFLFKDSVKEKNMFDSIATSSGFLIDGNGTLADVRLYERGFYIGSKFGKLFPVLGPNPNSGILVCGGIGFLQHRIRIENPGNVAPQIAGDYKKGYDRLCNGLAANESVGYLYMGNSRFVSFYAGLEFYQGWTQSRRSYDYDKMSKDETKRFDSLWGFKVSWIIPLYKRSPQKFYFY